jgi:hypothetical protein
MRRQAIVALLALASCLAWPGRIWAQDFGLFGRVLSDAEATAIKGGETYASVSLGRGLATVTSIPRDSYGMDYSRASSFSVSVHNRVDYKTVNEKTYSYDTARFPKGSASMSVREISDEYRQDRYGSSKGEWIATDAKRLVTAYPNKADETPDRSKPYIKEDYGYFWHANNAKPFEESKSFGCLISPQKDLDRVIWAIKNDIGPKRIEVH